MTKSQPSESLLPSELEILRGHSLFQPLSEEIQSHIWRVGRVATYRTGLVVDIRSPSVEFLNFVLSGDLAVEALQMDQNIRVRKAGSKFVFGTIDSFLGTGRFQRAKALSESRVFALDRAHLLELIHRNPELNRHFARLRLGIALRMAEHHAKHRAKDESNPPRVAMRFSAIGMQVRVRIENQKESHLIENVSESGLFVKGELPSSIGDQVSIVIEPPKDWNATIHLTSRIIRKTDEGTGFTIDNVDDVTMSAWRDLVERIRFLRIDQLLRPRLYKLKEPLSLMVIAPKVATNGEVTEIGFEGACFHSPMPLPAKAILTDGKSFRILTEVVEQRDADNYVLAFPRLDPKEENAIGKLIPSDAELTREERRTEKNIETQSTVLTRTIASKTNLCRFYFQELVEQIISVQTSERVKVGDSVEIHLAFDPREIQIPRSHSKLVIKGLVIRRTDVVVMVKLEHVDLNRVRAIKLLVDQISQEDSEKHLKRAVHTEQNVKLRRHTQLALVLILLVGVVLWAASKIQLV